MKSGRGTVQAAATKLELVGPTSGATRPGRGRLAPGLVEGAYPLRLPLGHNAAMAVPTGNVTFLLTDIEGSTRNWDASESNMRSALGRHDALLARYIGEHGGEVLTERGEGDSFFAVFPTAAGAVAASLAIQLAIGSEHWPERAPIKVRVALHTGEAGQDVRGPDVNRCARLRALAHGGQILISATTAALARAGLPDDASLQDLGQHRLRDLTVPERVFQLDHPGLPWSFPPLASLDAFRHNLPVQLTSFVGRAADLSTVTGLVAGHRLVTLIGAGGAGKTRLALQAGGDLLEDFGDGVWFVDLAPLTDPSLVPTAVATAVGVGGVPGRALVDTIAEHLATRTTLVILDNCEHLVGAASKLVDQLLRGAVGLRILATSREGLGVPGELVWRVPSLSAPDPDGARTAASAGRFEAVQLFCDRAEAQRPGFALTDDNADAIGHICRRLDGVPLAIELAAARVKVLAPDDLLARLEDRFRVLTGGSRTALPRQQTLRATVDWSHDLLGEAERVLFRRLTLFAGGFDLDACEAVCGTDRLAGELVLDLLGGLVDKSLATVEVNPHGEVRYSVLETLRQYGREKLEAAGEADAVGDAHLRWYLDLAERAYAGRIAAEAVWLARLERDLDNLRAALDRARGVDPDAELRLAGALSWLWYLHTEHASEGRARLAHVLDGRNETTAVMARALSGAAMTANWAGNPTEAASLAERSIEIWRGLGDELELGLALEALGWAKFFIGDVEGALAPMEESVACMRRIGDRRLINRATVALGQVLVPLNDFETGEPLAQETLAVGRELGAPRDIHYSLHYLGDYALVRGNGTEALGWYAQSMEAALAYGNVAEAALELEALAMALAAGDRREEAVRLGAAAAARMAELGFDTSGVAWWTRLRERFLGAAREALDEPMATALAAEGRAMGWDAARAEALALATG
jgi:predicted ATPase/class 3 adenylate cyclase